MSLGGWEPPPPPCNTLERDTLLHENFPTPFGEGLPVDGSQGVPVQSSATQSGTQDATVPDRCHGPGLVAMRVSTISTIGPAIMIVKFQRLFYEALTGTLTLLADLRFRAPSEKRKLSELDRHQLPDEPHRGVNSPRSRYHPVVRAGSLQSVRGVRRTFALALTRDNHSLKGLSAIIVVSLSGLALAGAEPIRPSGGPEAKEPRQIAEESD
ncbi:hypothetical protein B0H14DRAFT_3480071 [Mycena olivaceomarginata]|nr:hypothetical protein B0H14DRAFT_3480071 [Mycena olivaceomarginata]